MAITEVNEDSTYDIDVVLYSSEGLPESPTKLYYRIDDTKSGQNIRAKTEIPAPSSVTSLTLLPADTAIIDQGNTSERRRITFTAEYGGATDVYNFEVDYEVKNLIYLN